MSTAASQPLDQAKLHEFVMRAVGEMGAAMNAALIVIGDKLGLYKAMSGAGPMTSAELAKKTEPGGPYCRNCPPSRPPEESSPTMAAGENTRFRRSRRLHLLTRRV